MVGKALFGQPSGASMSRPERLHLDVRAHRRQLRAPGGGTKSRPQNVPSRSVASNRITGFSMSKYLGDGWDSGVPQFDAAGCGHALASMGETLCVRKNPIRMYPYDPDWAPSFERERLRLTPILQPFLVQPLEHIGSTSVPGLVAKPIVDMLAVVKDISPMIAEEESLRQIGWLLAPEPGDDIKRRLSFCTPSRELRTHHLHIVR